MLTFRATGYATRAVLRDFDRLVGLENTIRRFDFVGATERLGGELAAGYLYCTSAGWTYVMTVSTSKTLFVYHTHKTRRGYYYLYHSYCYYYLSCIHSISILNCIRFF